MVRVMAGKVKKIIPVIEINSCARRPTWYRRHMKQETLIQKAGGPQAVALALGIAKASLAKWRLNHAIPPKHLNWFARTTGKKAGQIAHLFASQTGDGK